MLRTDWHIQLPRSTPMLAGTQPQSCCSEPLKTNAVDDVVPRIKNKCSSCSLALLKNKAKPWPCSSKGKRICYHERDETIRRQACLMQRYIQISDFCGDGEHVCNAVCYRQDHYYPHSIEPLNFGEWESFTNPSLAARFDDVQEEEYDSVPEELSALVLQYESPLQHRVRDSEEVVRRCVQLDGLALEHASPRLRQNKEIVKAAVAQNHDALLFAGTNLRQDPEFIVQLMEDTCAEVFWNADKEGVQGILLQGQARPDLSLRALLVYPSLLKFLSSEMADYPGIAEKVLQLDGKILEFLPPAFRSDRHFVKIAMKSGGLLHHAPETLQSDAAYERKRSVHLPDTCYNTFLQCSASLVLITLLVSRLGLLITSLMGRAYAAARFASTRLALALECEKNPGQSAGARILLSTFDVLHTEMAWIVLSAIAA